MKKGFKPISNFLENSNLDKLFSQAQEHRNALGVLAQKLSQSSEIINVEDILSCDISATQMELSCREASKAMPIQFAAQAALPELQQQFPEIFIPTIRQVKVKINLNLQK